MSQITIRGMDEEAEKTIRRIARQKGKSLNKVILDMIYEQTGRKKNSEEPHGSSLREFAGGWNRERADEFLDSIESCEQIDEAMWK